MSLFQTLYNGFRTQLPGPAGRSGGPTTGRPPLALERLDERALPSVSVSVSVGDGSATEAAGEIRYFDDFVSAGSGGLVGARDVAFGPDGTLYVASQLSDQVLRYEAETGAFLGAAVTGGMLDDPWALGFGPDGKLYVTGRASNNVVRYDPATGAVDEFVPAGAGLWNPKGIAFGGDGHLYVANADAGTADASPLQDQVVRYQGPAAATPGQFGRRRSPGAPLRPGVPARLPGNAELRRRLGGDGAVADRRRNGG